ncbi:hypothetical protein [Streptomyces sp. NPDC006510]|uniref:hypothetical protein n=1 Tax=Streptomyces sp. NPDC006510 TaxID=3155600 RepID=UPI0033B5F5BD
MDAVRDTFAAAGELTADRVFAVNSAAPAGLDALTISLGSGTEVTGAGLFPSERIVRIDWSAQTPTAPSSCPAA